MAHYIIPWHLKFPRRTLLGFSVNRDKLPPTSARYLSLKNGVSCQASSATAWPGKHPFLPPELSVTSSPLPGVNCPPRAVPQVYEEPLTEGSGPSASSGGGGRMSIFGPSGVSTVCMVPPSRASLTGPAICSRPSPSCSTTWSPSIGSPDTRPISTRPVAWSTSSGSRRRTVPSGYSASQRSSLACSVTVIMLFLLRSPALFRLFEEILGLAQLILGRALRLVRASFSLLGFIAGEGSGGLFGLTLCLVQCPFTLVLGAALSAHVLLLPSSGVTCKIMFTRSGTGSKGWA